MLFISLMCAWCTVPGSRFDTIALFPGAAPDFLFSPGSKIRLFNGRLTSPNVFAEFQEPWYYAGPDESPLCDEAHLEARLLKEAFRARYPVDPPHPDRAEKSPVFLRDWRRLEQRLASSYAIYLTRSRVRTEYAAALFAEEEAAAVFAEAGQSLLISTTHRA